MKILLYLSLLLVVTVDAADIFQKSRSTDNSGKPAPAVGFSSEPRMVSDGAVELPLLKLIKRGVQGTVVVSVDVDQTGTVEKCTVKKGVDTLFDSLFCASLYQALFTPAYEEGTAVPSTVTLQYTFDPEEVLYNSAHADPEIYGVVREAQTGIPVKNARINLEVTDSTADPDLTIPMSSYFQLIGTVPGQSEKNGILSTVADTLGRFFFRLLPACPVRMAFIASGYEIAHALLTVNPGTSKKVTCGLEFFAQDSSEEIVVYGRALNPVKIDIEEEQVASGLTHYISSILQTKATIRTVPESRSLMMVRGGNPYDNRYYICGIPFLAPFHFGGHAYADIDGLMISALSEIDVTIDRIAGRQVDVSGFRVDAQPGIYRPANRALRKRPELSVDLNTLGQDFLFSLSRKNSDASVQLGFTREDTYTLKFLNARRVYVENEFGTPSGSGNITLTGAASHKSWELNSFSWFAWDNYVLEGDEYLTVPWGMASVTAHSPNGRAPVIHAGGSHQYFAKGIRKKDDKYESFVTLSNGAVSFAFDSLYRGAVNASVEILTEVTDWKGTVDHTYQHVRDSVIKITGQKYYIWENSTTEELHRASGREVMLQMHGSVGKTVGNVTFAADLLGAGFILDDTPDAIGDAGVSVSWQGIHGKIGLYGGRITSRPDIRGLPETRYRRQHNSTYLVSLPALFRWGAAFDVSVQPYLRKKSREPKLDHDILVWRPEESTGLYCAGVDAEVNWNITDWLSINGAGSYSHSFRGTWENRRPYEWDIPWGGRSRIHLHFGSDTEMHFYITGICSEGLLIPEGYETEMERTPFYGRIDLSAQYRSSFIDHRFLTRYDAYFNMFNVTDRFNAVDYFVNADGNLKLSTLGHIMIEMGVRLGLRL